MKEVRKVEELRKEKEAESNIQINSNNEILILVFRKCQRK
jgi:hypothetical protein